MPVLPCLSAHAAIAAHALSLTMTSDEMGIFLGTAHPAKFKDVVEQTLSRAIELPSALAAVKDKPILSASLQADFDELKAHLFAVL